jgi:aspartyl/glutamyl-tRNA(Asn/Gln) amidotransferase C subunit
MEIEKIKAVADFSKLEFSNEEILEFSKQFEKIIAFAEEIKKAKITVKEKHDTVLSIEDLREDTVGESLPIEAVLRNAKRKQGRYFVVPKVVD